jgi:hypothetical protein
VTPIDLVKLTGGPGSIQLLLILTLVGICLHRGRPRQRMIARLLLGITVLLYWVLATPATALAIEAYLPKTIPAIDRTHFDTVVVLDGDNRRGRLTEALALWREASPSRVIVSGQDWLRDELIAAGIPEYRVQTDSTTANTREQIAWLGVLTSHHSSGEVAVIASRLQAPRVSALIRRAQLRAIVVAAPIDVDPQSTGVWALVPSYPALRLSRDALYECVALEYYAFRGWINPVARGGEPRRGSHHAHPLEGIRVRRV